jgi:hypothetical protein
VIVMSANMHADRAAGDASRNHSLQMSWSAMSGKRIPGRVEAEICYIARHQIFPPLS